ncbi:hypothetical protein BO71DRAFT_403445 [Aspergillus ellipticus CBS 707.79]|uniref:Uncharacterized protein n=1 Tax=Aspergillus ellipticus CBS 707.79 TaxID=1448320 RepID=A0A319CUZ3_9EURO|nr:hypothetical protein BO71DRAFT_403445 [Aspergillus ellipticus CBS 707.79]
MSTINIVKFSFSNQATAQTILQYMAIAYQAATVRKISLKVVFVRSGIHSTTSIHGKYQKDPRGEHLTLCFKDAGMLARGTHIASHGYVGSKNDWNILEATHTSEKCDSTIRKGRPAWPSDDKIQYEVEVAFGHVPDESDILLDKD